MKLMEFFGIIKEEEAEDISDTTGDNDYVIEFTDANFTISIFRPTKTLLFTAQQHNAFPEEMVNVVNALRDKFRLIHIYELQKSVFELVFDPREDFDKIIDFIKMASEKDQQIV